MRVPQTADGPRASGSEHLMHPVTTSGIAFHARWQSAPLRQVEADGLGHSSRALSGRERASQG